MTTIRLTTVRDKASSSAQVARMLRLGLGLETDQLVVRFDGQRAHVEAVVRGTLDIGEASAVLQSLFACEDVDIEVYKPRSRRRDQPVDDPVSAAVDSGQSAGR